MRKRIITGIVVGVSGIGCLFAGFLMTSVSAEIVKEAIKKGEN